MAPWQGLLVTVAIGLHNVPEGLAVATVLVARGIAPWHALWWTLATSLPQPLFALPSFLFVDAFSALLPLALGFAAGCMVWMVFAELIPDALADAPHAQVNTPTLERDTVSFLEPLVSRSCWRFRVVAPGGDGRNHVCSGARGHAHGAAPAGAARVQAPPHVGHRHAARLLELPGGPAPGAPSRWDMAHPCFRPGIAALGSADMHEQARAGDAGGAVVLARMSLAQRMGGAAGLLACLGGLGLVSQVAEGGPLGPAAGAIPGGLLAWQAWRVMRRRRPAATLDGKGAYDMESQELIRASGGGVSGAVDAAKESNLRTVTVDAGPPLNG